MAYHHDCALHLPFAATDAISIGIYLVTASCFWIQSELTNVPGTNIGNALCWIFYPAPIAASSVLGNLI